MQYSAIIISLAASLALAIPSQPLAARHSSGGSGSGSGSGSGGSSSYTPCGSSVLLDSQAVCCSGDVAGLVDLTCATVSKSPISADDFKDICSTTGQTAECCTLTALGIGLVCATPEGL